MKVAILVGGKGTRLSEETIHKPKPLVEIGEMPILWHILKIYSHHGFDDFILCTGYKKNLIREYFLKNIKKNRGMNVEMMKNSISVYKKSEKIFDVTLADTGIETMTGGRLKKIKKLVENDTFCVSYGDDLKAVDIKKLVKFHKKHGKLATMTIARNPDRFGIIKIKKNIVTNFQEKPVNEKNWINGGYFVFEPAILDYIKDKNTVLEQEPLKELIKQRELVAFKYYGKYQPMDTMKDLLELRKLWKNNQAYWKIWK